MNKFQTYIYAKKSDELKKLIAENPDLPIVVLAGEDANIGDHCWMFCSDIDFAIDEILDCDYCDYDDTVFNDRDRLEEKVGDDLWDDYDDEHVEEFEAAVKARLKELEPCWKKVIAIYVNN